MTALPEYVSRAVAEAPELDDGQRDIVLAGFAGLQPGQRDRLPHGGGGRDA